MTKKLLMLICSLLFVACVTLGLSGCGLNNDNSNNNENNNLPNTNTIQTNGLVFGYNVDKNELDNHFIVNGQKTSETSDEYCISNNLATVSYSPKTSQFNIIRQVSSNSTVSNAAYQYTYTCGMQISLYSLLSTAKFVGEYHHSALNLNTLNVAAEYTANFNFTVDKFNSTNEICDFHNAKYTSQITYATNWASADRMFQPKETGEALFNQFQSCITAVSQIFVSISGTTFSAEYNADNYSSIDFSNVVLNNSSVKLDGSKHSIYADNIPNNVIVEYNGNEQTETGNHAVTATFKDPKGNILHSIKGVIEITDLFNVTVEYIYGYTIKVNGERGIVVGTQSFQAKYNSDILEYCNFPNGFVWEDTSDKYEWMPILRDDYTWKGYGDQTFAVSVIPKYEGYVQVFSDTNSSVNGAIIKFSALQTTYENSTQSAKIYGSENLVAFKPSDIKTIKIFNIDNITTLNGEFYTNLETIDLSDCVCLKTINGLINDCKSLKTVIAPYLPNLKMIGDYFLANTNIIDFNFDMSALEEIGNNFLYNSLYGEEMRTISIDLKSIKSIRLTNFLGSKNYASSPIINLYIYDYKISNVWFDKSAKCNIYVSSQLDYFNTLFSEYPNINVYQITNIQN